MQYLNEFDEFSPQIPGARAQDMDKDAYKSTGQEDEY